MNILKSIQSPSKFRDLTIYFLMIFSFLFYSRFYLAPSSFGGSNCNEIKKEVVRLENLVRSEQKSFLKFEGMKIQGSIAVQFERSKKNQYLQRLGKATYNNQNCFTKSQYDQILRKRFWTAPYTIYFTSRSMASGSECRDNPTSRKEIDLGIYEPKNSKPGVVCDVPTYLVVEMKNHLYGPSIYTF